MKVAINGFGRIGRLTFRSFLERNLKDVKIVAINDLGSIDSNLHLLKYDSIHGELNEKFEVTNNKLLISNEEVIFSNEPDPLKLNWKKLGVNLVIESTGRFTKRADAQKHIDSGAKKVLISAPASDPDITVVYGINQEKVNENHKIISNGSCTTNCLAPLAYLINKKIGIDSGYMTTVHSVTGDQNTIDTLHKDLRRARNSLTSMIPTSTGAARAVAEVLPELKGKLDGSAIRVPTPNVSLIDFKFLSKKDTTIGEINKTFVEAEADVSIVCSSTGSGVGPLSVASGFVFLLFKLVTVNCKDKLIPFME